jgi:uncharacterized protein (TIGR02466 family)
MERALDIATPEFLATIKQHVLQLEKTDPGRQVSNFGGWHSEGDLFASDLGALKSLASEILKLTAEASYQQIRNSYPDCLVDAAFVGRGWANVLRNGDYNKPHNHPGSVWSGVFYVALGNREAQPADNGWIEFIDPRPGNVHSSKVKVAPKEGHVLLFPSWLFHYVNPFRGTGERISIAFNTTAEIFPAA